MLIDPFQRKISYIRVSVTDRCDFRCTYCMSEDMEFLPKKDVLSLEELDRLCNTFIDLGVKKIRITGGEPLVRKNIIQLFKSLGKKLDRGLEELTLTTNGSQLDRYAEELFNSGVRRINISLDSLDKHKFKKITRNGNFDRVLKGIMTAKKVGLKIKINTVALKGINDDVSTLKTLSYRLFECGIMPYYMNQLDLVSGSAHFEVEKSTLLSLQRALLAELPGYLVPKFVQEQPFTASKVPLIE